jgi:hypothetical protein
VKNKKIREKVEKKKSDQFEEDAKFDLKKK